MGSLHRGRGLGNGGVIANASKSLRASNGISMVSII